MNDSVPSGDLEAKITEASVGKFASTLQSMKKVRALHLAAPVLMERHINRKGKFQWHASNKLETLVTVKANSAVYNHNV